MLHKELEYGLSGVAAANNRCYTPRLLLQKTTPFLSLLPQPMCRAKEKEKARTQKQDFLPGSSSTRSMLS